MTSYSITHPERGQISFKDRKRYWWCLSLLWVLFPVFAVAAFYQSDSFWVLFFILEFGLLVTPMLDFIVSTDPVNPPEEIVPQLDADPYYRRLTYAVIPLHFVALLVGAWFAANQPMHWLLYILFAVLCGVYSGLSINTAHEVGHKTTKAARFWSRVTLAITGYGHFCIEHNVGHHRDVATPEDPASSRMGESFYRFALREIPGAMRRGWQTESDRLQRRGYRFWTIQNHILQSYAMTLLLLAGMVLMFGWLALPFFVIHNVFAWLQLTSANYIEHYGLLREKKADGKYERCQPHHSWNTNHIVSNLMLFQLERHSDHHANPSRPYQSLRSFPNLPELPAGYYGMYLAAYIPFWWYRLMDKRLLAVPHINGDFSKINLDPKHAERLKRQYADFSTA